jgi:hypothetical protein
MRKAIVCIFLLLSLAAWGQYGPNPPALCGTWVKMSTGSGYSSSQSITLYENGTYESSGESSTSGANGSTAGQSGDSGTWRLQGDQIIANSRSEGPMQFTLILRNHPKTGDPMIVLDGDAYVTASPRQPWPDELTD